MPNGLTTSERILVDTNILVYAFDPSDQTKHRIAADWITKLLREDRLVLSVQTLNEFYMVAIHPRKPLKMPAQIATEIIRDLSLSCEILPLTADATADALGAVDAYHFSFWDSLIWAVAKRNGVPVLLSEDFQHGREIEGVRFVNPFIEPATS